MRRNLSFLIALALICVLVAIRVIDPLPVASLREAYFDTLQRLHPRPHDPVAVRIIDIDERALADVGQWPWPRQKLAELVVRLEELGAAVVAFDFLFSEPDRLSPIQLGQNPLVRQIAAGTDLLSKLEDIDSDTAFANSFDRLPVVLGTSEAGIEGPEPILPIGGFVELGRSNRPALFSLTNATGVIDQLLETAAGIGVVNISPASLDGTVREVPLVWATATGFHNTLALEALRVGLGESSTLLFGHETELGLQGLAVGEFEIPTSEAGTFRVHYRSDISDLFISAKDVLEPDLSDEVRPYVDGHIVFVGTSSAGLLDIHTTASGDQIPGVAIHAQVLEQILTGAFIERSDYSSGIEIISLAAICLLMAAALAFVSPIYALAIGAVASTVLTGSSWNAFTNNGLLVDITFPLLSGFLTFSLLAFLQYSLSDQERRAIRRSFTKYVSEDVLAEIERHGHDLQLGGELRDVTVMFSDIRNFTPLSESMEPQDLVALLNDLFSELTDDILEYSGTIDKYIGDSIMAFWNAPLAVAAHEAASINAALKMRDTLKGFNSTRRADGLKEVGMSVGLASGQACVGNIGSRERYNYSVVGDTVNLAARIEDASRMIGYDIVVTREVAKAAGQFAVLSAGWVDLKGVSSQTDLCIVVGDEETRKSAEFRELEVAHTNAITQIVGGLDAKTAIASAQAIGTRMDPRLSEFYDLMGNRQSHFALEQS